MLGFTLTILSSFFGEVSDVIGKQKMRQKEVSVWTTGFLTLIFGIVFFLVTALIRGGFHFSMASLPTLIPRIILEITLSWITITALSRANRSTFGFVRTLTIPLLLLVDIIMGYGVGRYQVVGMLIITIVIALFVGFSGRIDKKGMGLLLLSSTIPVATLSLFKYNINHFNSVETEQIIVSLAILIYFYFMAIYRAKENPILFLAKPIFLLQACVNGLASAVGGFAYLFVPPSVATAILRGGSVLFSTISGSFYFKEKRRLFKFAVALGIVAGLAFLT